MFLNTAIDQHPELEPAEVLRRVRGTVQADILKEDQGQNTCIFSTEFSLGMMADIQEWFVEHEVRSFYSVSISGYHIAEAGANPISQLAFTLSNGFTYVESYLARGLAIDDFAPNLSFFFSNGMDPEYAVLGRVARRIWAVAMRDRYGANERSQKLKYHVQTSGRSLHAQEMDFNDIRTTLQALIALYDNANSLHTNAYDEAVTTPTAESVRRALAIQLIINREWGLSMNENPNQGSFVLEQLTDLVEEAVLQELERISERGGVLGAMETGYQRGRIQDESMLYEQRKHDGTLPLIGVNTFLDPKRPRRGTAHARAAAQHRRGEAEPDRPAARLPGAPRHRAPGRPRAAADRRPRRRQPVRRAHGRRPGVLARRDHPHPLRGRRPLPPQRVDPVRRNRSSVATVCVDAMPSGDLEVAPHGRADRRVARAGLHPRRAAHHRRRGRVAPRALRGGVRPVEQGARSGGYFDASAPITADDRRRPRPAASRSARAQVARPAWTPSPTGTPCGSRRSCSTCRSTGSRPGPT